MGLSASTPVESQGQSKCGDKDSSEDDPHTEPRMEEGSQTINNNRWAQLLFSLQSVAKLQRAATRARIEVRQKGREASFKRQDVWVRDDKFMREIQRLDAQGKLRGFEELSRLAAECQAARDLLGPLEQDSIDVELQWQGHLWRLREAEEELYNEFEEEFRDAAEYSTFHGGEATSSYSSNSDYGSQTSDAEGRDEQTAKIENNNTFAAQDLMQLDLQKADDQKLENLSSVSDLDSGVGDIDSVLGFPPPIITHGDSATGDKPLANEYGSRRALPKSRYTGIELYPEPLEVFSTRRERVSQWLMNTALESRLEGVTLFSILRDLLAKEDQSVPSNWSQLVIAYWELDEASRSAREPEDIQKPNVLVETAQSAKNESANQDKNGASIATNLHRHMPSNLSPRDSINETRVDSERSTNKFKDTTITSQAPPTPAPPSPPHWHSNSNPASSNIRRQGKPP
ncbi:uncharacterized protein PAC_17099 [Phialocephala subalpina]|uniref:Uncharacterized protein n=1 Tax=Phialocephala subalpina TaxID=576137 RepID=A0A1L7XQ93_9HELO|nr:uncharacterized protein PAC_17099 [Phialocephala subalpina]